MDYKTELENAKQKLFALGFDSEKYDQLLELAAEELMDTALKDLQEKDLTTLETLEKELVEKPTNIEEANRNIELIFSTAYGEQAEEKKQGMLLDYLNMTIQQTESAADLIRRYQAGDPTAIAAIETNKNNPEIAEIMKELEDENDIDNITNDIVEEGWRESQEAAQQVNNNVTNTSGETQNMAEMPTLTPQPTQE